MPQLIDGLDQRVWRLPHVIMIMGKGGVGKTTVGLRLAIELARLGRRVLLASLDPAGHLLEYLGLPGPLREVEAAPGIRAIQYEVDGLARKVAEEYSLLLRRLMPGLQALGVEDVVETVREAPGFEEEVFLRILSSLYERRDVDVVIVDMPPTGIALRVVALPRLHLFWVERLRELREKIVSIKYAIANALGRHAEADDPVLRRLEELRSRYQGLLGEIEDPLRTSVVAVATPEPLPVYEVSVIAKKLQEHRVALKMIVANRVLGERAQQLGLEEMERQALTRLEEIRCSLRPSPSLAVIAHMSRPPSSLRDAEALGDYILKIKHGCKRE
ncbi:Anion-transporting ATPase [Pyrodictium delaneyi]|uniref:Anion-transporting ATPase n=1 Tax=Pyrodictium delaneyi TaxID=1273541 RepID=A0A0P0N4V8_9CREN|nr:TRC40/GET3/ArsA family transport-energizing ATPase [Pyrodictium delaneyi]ALL01812.1 Anion-transporting ATPase [Pyrodictium delaneyi]